MDICLYLYRVYATDPPVLLPCKDPCDVANTHHAGVPGITLAVPYNELYCTDPQWFAGEAAIRQREDERR